MKKLMKRMVLCLLFAVSVWCGSLVADRERLNEQLIRLHVVANSDSREDQAVKLQVRDAVLEGIQADMARITDVSKAREYLEENLPKLETIANSTLKAAGFKEEAVVTLCREAFDTRYYDTFTLPAGVYEALRITIGEGEGHNWWCVAFPALCLPATAAEFEDTAAGAGFPQPLTGALTGEEDYEIRFFFLDALGRIENSFFRE